MVAKSLADIPVAETETSYSGVRVIERIVADCAPNAVVKDFKAPFVGQVAASEAHLRTVH
jgi:hypothetical protein